MGTVHCIALFKPYIKTWETCSETYVCMWYLCILCPRSWFPSVLFQSLDGFTDRFLLTAVYSKFAKLASSTTTCLSVQSIWQRYRGCQLLFLCVFYYMIINQSHELLKCPAETNNPVQWFDFLIVYVPFAVLIFALYNDVVDI